MSSESVPEREYEFTPSTFGKYTRVADGTEFSVGAREVREARARGAVAPGKSPPRPERTLQDAPGGPDSPRRVRAPRTIPQAPKPTKKAQALEFGMLVGFCFDGVALVRGRFWALSEDEKGKMGGAIAGVAPQLPQKVVQQIALAGPWVNLVMTANAIVLPRIAQDMQFQAELRERARAPKEPPPPPPPPTNLPFNGSATIAEDASKGEHVHTTKPDIPGL